MRHIHADHMIAAANDTTIEWQRLSYDTWANIGKSGDFTFYPESQYRQRPAPHPHQAMMDQAASDPSIEWQINDYFEGWLDVFPEFNPESEYRQKPAEPKMVDLWQWAVKWPDNPVIFAMDEFFADAVCALKSRPGFIIVSRIEGSKISVEVSQ
jgi:hypothetical protein